MTNTVFMTLKIAILRDKCAHLSGSLDVLRALKEG